MSFLHRILGRPDNRRALEPLYRAIVTAARDPSWYREGGVPDTVDGRFNLVAAVTALVLLRMEAEGSAGKEPSVLLTESFIDDMDASLRQIGIGDYVVGKHVGRLMGALGGRLHAFRSAEAAGEGFESAVRRNLFHDSPPSESALGWTADRLEDLAKALEATSLADLVAARLPQP